MSYSCFGSKSIGEGEWKPHGCNVATNPNSTVSEINRHDGPDWTSSLRCTKASNSILTDNPSRGQGKKLFPGKNDISSEEWSFYWDGTKNGKRCLIDGIHNGNLETTKETTVKSKLGNKLKVSEQHRSINSKAPGDKSYSVPEYSTGFHKEGSTLPAVNFGRSNKVIADTFIPLQPLPKERSVAYKEKEFQRRQEEEIIEVEDLEKWTAAPVLVPGVAKLYF